MCLSRARRRVQGPRPTGLSRSLAFSSCLTIWFDSVPGEVTDELPDGDERCCGFKDDYTLEDLVEEGPFTSLWTQS